MSEIKTVGLTETKKSRAEQNQDILNQVLQTRHK